MIKLFFLLSVAYAGMYNTVIETNSSVAALNAGQTFTGVGFECAPYNALIASVKTDQDATLYVDLSPDNSNWDSTLSFDIVAGANSVHRLTVTKKYCRVRITNTSASNQTYMRLQTLVSDAQHLTSSLNAQSAQDADAIITKSIPAEILIAEGKLSGYDIVNKYGLNPSVSQNTLFDIWGNGTTTYAGFPASAEPLEIVSSSSSDDTGGTGAITVRATCLDANYQTVQVTATLDGLTPVTTGTSVIRCHTAQVLSAGTGGVNAGTITFRQGTTEANVFLLMQVGKNQTNCACYTVPAGKTAYMKSLNVAIDNATTATGSGQIWTRGFNAPFRARRPFFVSNTIKVEDDIFGGLVFTEKSDIVIRMNAVTANSVGISAGFDMILVDN